MIRRSRIDPATFLRDHEIFSTVILSLPLIQEGQLSVSGERMSARTGWPHRGLDMSRKSVVSVNWRAQHNLNNLDWAVKLQTSQTINF